MMVLSEIVKSDYDKVDPEEIIIKLKEVLAFIQKKKQEGKL
jgi:hypothetical protein